MSDQEIITAFEKLHRLHSTSGEAVGQFAAIGAIRQVIFRPGSTIFVAYERDANEARDAVKLLGDPKATALIDEMMNLTQRMIQLEAALPPARPDINDLKTGPADDDDSTTTAPPTVELNLAGVALYLGSGTLWNYLARTVPRLKHHYNNRYVLSQPELMKWCKWNGATTEDDIEVLIDKVTQYLSTLLPNGESQPMTDREILEAQKLIADMRNVLTVLMGTTDEDKLLALGREKVPGALKSFSQLYRRHKSELMITLEDHLAVEGGLAWFMCPDDSPKATPGAVKLAHRVDKVLVKTAQALSEKRQ
jgi:hypothetical protein